MRKVLSVNTQFNGRFIIIPFFTLLKPLLGENSALSKYQCVYYWYAYLPRFYWRLPLPFMWKRKPVLGQPLYWLPERKAAKA